MKKVVKLGSKQLRKLVSEAIETKQFGAQEPFALREGYSGGDPLGAYLSAVEEQWEEEYDEGDPSMESVGESGWHEQVKKAVAQLKHAVEGAFADADSALFNGEFFDDRESTETLEDRQKLWSKLNLPF